MCKNHTTFIGIFLNIWHGECSLSTFYLFVPEGMGHRHHHHNKYEEKEKVEEESDNKIKPELKILPNWVVFTNLQFNSSSVARILGGGTTQRLCGKPEKGFPPFWDSESFVQTWRETPFGSHKTKVSQDDFNKYISPVASQKMPDEVCVHRWPRRDPNNLTTIKGSRPNLCKDYRADRSLNPPGTRLVRIHFPRNTHSHTDVDRKWDLWDYNFDYKHAFVDSGLLY